MLIDYKNQKLVSSEEKTTAEVQYAVEDTKLQLKSDLLATKKALAEKKAELTQLKQTYPLDVQNILDVQEEIESLKAGVKAIEKLETEFGF